MKIEAIFLVSTLIICKSSLLNACPSNCICSPTETDGMDVNCSDKNLWNVPKFKEVNVKYLDLSYNNISFIRNDDFIRWGKQVMYLYLNNNKLGNIGKGTFKNLPNLAYLYLDYNAIKEIDLNVFEDNIKIWKLILNGNNISISEDVPFLNSTSLGWLELEKCNIRSLSVNFFKNITNLVVIRLSHNKINYLDTSLFRDLKLLRYLHLEGNHISSINVDTFKTNSLLQWLYVRNNPLGNLPGEYFLHAPSLIMLDLGSCNITDVRDKYFSNLDNLRNLRLNDNRLKTFDLLHLPINLEILDLSGNSIEMLSITEETSSHMPQMEYLDISNNNFECNCKLKHLWSWCLHLRKKARNMCGSNQFCPEFDFMSCRELASVSNNATNSTFNFKSRHIFIPDDSTEDIDEIEHDAKEEVELLTDTSYILNDKDHEEKGLYGINGNIASSVLGSSVQSEAAKGVWNIVLYSCIGVLGLLCLIGMTALVVDVYLGRRKKEDTNSMNSYDSRLRQVRLELMERVEVRNEARVQSHHQGFDYVSVRTTEEPKNPPIPRGKSRRSSTRN